MRQRQLDVARRRRDPALLGDVAASGRRDAAASRPCDRRRRPAADRARPDNRRPDCAERDAHGAWCGGEPARQRGCRRVRERPRAGRRRLGRVPDHRPERAVHGSGVRERHHWPVLRRHARHNRPRGRPLRPARVRERRERQLERVPARHRPHRQHGAHRVGDGTGRRREPPRHGQPHERLRRSSREWIGLGRRHRPVPALPGGRRQLDEPGSLLEHDLRRRRPLRPPRRHHRQRRRQLHLADRHRPRRQHRADRLGDGTGRRREPPRHGHPHERLRRSSREWIGLGRRHRPVPALARRRRQLDEPGSLLEHDLRRRRPLRPPRRDHRQRRRQLHLADHHRPRRQHRPDRAR